MRVVLATILTLLLMATYTIGRMAEQDLIGVRSGVSEASIIAMARDRITAGIIPSPGKSGSGLVFENGRCVVEWRWWESAYGSVWLYEAVCGPEPRLAYGPALLVYVTAYYCERVPGWPLGDGGLFCGTMYNGETVHVGAAACGEAWALGTVLEVEGWGVVTCKDRGILDWTQVDIFMPTNREVYQSGILSTWRTAREVLQ